jgi:hypothetical protein
MSCCFGKDTNGIEPKKLTCRLNKRFEIGLYFIYSADQSDPSSNRPIIPVNKPENNS